MPNISSFVLDGMGYESNLGVDIGISSFFNCLTGAGQSLSVISGIPAGCVNEMLHPRPPREAILAGELSLGLREFLIQSLEVGAGNCLPACCGAGFAIARGSLVQGGQRIVERRKVEERRYLQRERCDHGVPRVIGEPIGVRFQGGLAIGSFSALCFKQSFQFARVNVERVRQGCEIIGQQVGLGHAQYQGAVRLCQSAPISEGGVTKVRVPVEIVVDGVVDAAVVLSVIA